MIRLSFIAFCDQICWETLVEEMERRNESESRTLSDMYDEYLMSWAESEGLV